MTRFILLFPLVACSKVDYDDLDTGTFKEVICSHPNSQFEAQVEVNYSDDGFTSVEFVLGQNDEFWITGLKRPDEDVMTWNATMQILEFDCYANFTYDFIVED